jgi:hypothetical protein
MGGSTSPIIAFVTSDETLGRIYTVHRSWAMGNLRLGPPIVLLCRVQRAQLAVV